MKGGMKGKGKGKQMQMHNGPREKIMDVAVTGEVVSSQGPIVWLRAHQQIDHPNAAMRGGKIFCHANDLVGGSLESMQPGAVVQFQAYADKNGIGATQVALF